MCLRDSGHGMQLVQHDQLCINSILEKRKDLVDDQTTTGSASVQWRAELKVAVVSSSAFIATSVSH